MTSAPCAYCERELIGAARWGVDGDGRLVCVGCVKRRHLGGEVTILTKATDPEPEEAPQQ